MTGRTSLRAAARAQFRALAGAEPRAAAPEAEPTAVATPLTTEARALYEAGVVPVREIARRAGVTERTLYKYVERGGWKRRYAKRNPRGAGGRFVPVEQAGAPHAAGLKALDPEGAARAAAECRRAGQLADQAATATAAAAEVRATAARERAARRRVEGLKRARLTTFNALNRALADLRKIEEPGGPGPDSVAAQVTWRVVDALTAQIDRLQAELAD